MDNFQIFEKAAALLETGKNVALVTVVSTTGSTPGKVGYKMLVWAKGQRTLGTVGGGLVEGKMIESAFGGLSKPSSKTFTFGLGDTPDGEKGICGGSVELLIETFDKDALPLFRDLVGVADSDESTVLLSIISPDALPRKILIRNGALSAATAETELSSEIASAIKEMAVAGHGAMRVSAGDANAFFESITRLPAIVIFGAGHLAEYIARYAKGVHFRVTVYDDRCEYADKERFPDADGIIVADFGRVLDKVRIDRRSYVVIVTRGHKYDEIVLEQVLKSDARYIGMIGSKRKTRTILDRLSQRGVPAESLGSIFSPIGISIGAVTPEEIALSIVCELVKIRRLGRERQIGHLALCRSGDST